MVCDLKTSGNPDFESQRGIKCRSNYSDYLRLIGYGGLVDSLYCGQEKVSIKVDGNYPLALMFKTQKRSKSRHIKDILNLFGFDCKLKCSNEHENEDVLDTTTPVIEKIDTIEDTIDVLPIGVTKDPEPLSSSTTTTTTTTMTSSISTTTTITG